MHVLRTMASWISRLGLVARRGFGRLTPDPFVLAVLLTAFVMVAGVILGDAGDAPGMRSRIDLIFAMLAAWGSSAGLWKLLAFGMQASLMLVLGNALAEAPVVRAWTSWLARRPATPRTLVGLTALVSISLCLLNWSLGLIGGAFLAREAGRQASARGWKLHYPLLCAAAYSGMMVWHGGLSGTAPLKVTGFDDLREVLGESMARQIGSIPLDQTLFGPLNLVVSGGLLVLGPLLFMAMTPADGMDPDPAKMPETALASQSRIDRPSSAPEGRLGVVERSAWITWLLALPMLLALGLYLAERGIGRLDLNTVNLALWSLALLLHRRPDRFLAACERGVRGVTGILVQFPLYAGIMGVMASAGLSARLTAWLEGVGPTALAPLTFLSAGLLNLFVPSGGGQWAVQGPILVEAAVDAGIPVADLVMAMAYGDQWTNMLQPFWALPLLGITGVRARDIVGYCALWMAVGGAFILGMLLWLV